MSSTTGADTRAAGDVDAVLEAHRRELTGYCYRMLGSTFEAEDAVQEVMTRAWRSYGRFEGRASVRTWLFRIASNVCFDALAASRRRALPMDITAPGTVESFSGSTLPEASWVEPAPDRLVVAAEGDPADVALARESVRLAFVAALQHLPPRQRAVLILREVLRLEAREVADLLDTTTAAVNSSLQRARATLADRDGALLDPSPRTLDAADLALLERYCDAFQRYDIDELTSLIREDATQSMPPYEHWLVGRDQIMRFWVGPGAECRGSRLVPVAVNGRSGFAQYRPSGPGGRHQPWAIQVPEVADGAITGFTFFIDPSGRLFARFGLPFSPEA